MILSLDTEITLLITGVAKGTDIITEEVVEEVEILVGWEEDVDIVGHATSAVIKKTHL